MPSGGKTKQRNGPRKPAEPQSVSRSTVEAYAGIIIAVVQAIFVMTFISKFILVLGLAYIAFDLLWRNEKTIHLPKRDRIPIAAFGVILVLATSINPLKQAYIKEYYFTPDPDVMYFTEFGTKAEIIPTPFGEHKFVIRGWPGGYMTIKSKLLENLKDRYQLIGFIFHHNGSIDIKDEIVGGESGRYDIPADDLGMKIVWSTTYPEQVIFGMRPTFYALTAIPANNQEKSFRTIRELVNAGGILIQVQAGPP